MATVDTRNLMVVPSHRMGAPDWKIEVVHHFRHKERTAFLQDCLNGDFESVSKQIECNSNIVKIEDCNKATSLMFASASKCGKTFALVFKCTRDLLQNKDDDGRNALFYAYKANHKAAVIALFNSGINVYTLDGQYALTYATDREVLTYRHTPPPSAAAKKDEPQKKSLSAIEKQEIITHFRTQPPRSLQEAKEFIDKKYSISISLAQLKTFFQHVGIEIRDSSFLDQQIKLLSEGNEGEIMKMLAETYHFNPTTELERQNNMQLLSHGERVLASYEAMPTRADGLHIQASDTYLWVGDLQGELGKKSKQIEFLNRALEILTKAVTDQHPKVAICLNNLGLALKDAGEVRKAIDCFNQALAIDIRTYGKKDPAIAMHYYNLGMAWREIGNPRAGIECLESALAIYESAFGKEHEDVAKMLSNLGCALMKFGLIVKAVDYLERALAIGEKIYGPEHPLVAVRLNNLGMALNHYGEKRRAIECYERALAIGEKNYGKEHPDAVHRLNNLGLTWHNLGKLNRARRYLCEAHTLALAFPNFGEDHPTTKIIRTSLEQVNAQIAQRRRERNFTTATNNNCIIL